mmetsp:Transcript_28910/g.71363  ORF Transcript_28910/g.71363 Transcript_28910/m.71363 type:complete len:331 (-) Transcript_28910:528-1520(-)
MGKPLPRPMDWSRLKMSRAPTGVPLTKRVVSRVSPPWANMMRSVPVPECVVGGPSTDSWPLGPCLAPAPTTAPLSSRVVTSSITSDAVALLCRVKFWVMVALAPARSTQMAGTSSISGPPVNTGDSLRELNTDVLNPVFSGSPSPRQYGWWYSSLKPRSSCGARKLAVDTEPYSWRPHPSRLRCSKNTLPPGLMDTRSGLPPSPGAMDHSSSDSAVLTGRSRSMMSTCTLDWSLSSGRGTTCTLSKRESRKMSRSAVLASSTLYSVPTLKLCSRWMTRGCVRPRVTGCMLSSRNTALTRVISPSMTCAMTSPVSMPSKCEMVPNVSPLLV